MWSQTWWSLFLQTTLPSILLVGGMAVAHVRWDLTYGSLTFPRPPRWKAFVPPVIAILAMGISLAIWARSLALPSVMHAFGGPRPPFYLGLFGILPASLLYFVADWSCERWLGPWFFRPEERRTGIQPVSVYADWSGFRPFHWLVDNVRPDGGPEDAGGEFAIASTEADDCVA